MAKRSEANERLKREYFAYLKEAQRYSEQSVDAVAKAISRFEETTRHRDFKAFHREQAMAFKRHLTDQPNRKGTGKLSKSTVVSTLKALRNFFFWLAGKRGFKSRFSYSEADYFNPSERDLRIALGRRPPLRAIARHDHDGASSHAFRHGDRTPRPSADVLHPYDRVPRPSRRFREAQACLASGLRRLP